MVKQFCLFDAYGTVVKLDDFFGRLQRGFAAAGIEIPLDVVTHAARGEMRFYVKNSVRAYDEPTLQQVRLECASVLSAGLAEKGYPISLDEATVGRILAESIAFHVYPDVPPVFEELQQRGVPMAIMSNWDYQIVAIMDELGLGRYVEFVLSSSAVGREKPAPEFFLVGLERVCQLHPHLKASDCLYIGDTFDNDVLGAQQIGMRPLWLVREEADLATGNPGAPHLCSMHDLLRFID